MKYGVFFPKRTEPFPLKDYKGHLVKKSSFKGLFEIKDGRTYTGTLFTRQDGGTVSEQTTNLVRVVRLHKSRDPFVETRHT